MANKIQFYFNNSSVELKVSGDFNANYLVTDEFFIFDNIVLLGEPAIIFSEEQAENINSIYSVEHCIENTKYFTLSKLLSIQDDETISSILGYKITDILGFFVALLKFMLDEEYNFSIDEIELKFSDIYSPNILKDNAYYAVHFLFYKNTKNIINDFLFENNFKPERLNYESNEGYDLNIVDGFSRVNTCETRTTKSNELLVYSTANHNYKDNTIRFSDFSNENSLPIVLNGCKIIDIPDSCVFDLICYRKVNGINKVHLVLISLAEQDINIPIVEIDLVTDELENFNHTIYRCLINEYYKS